VLVGDLYVGVAIEERAAELDDKVEHGLCTSSWARITARTAQSELGESSSTSTPAMKSNGGKLLQTQFTWVEVLRAKSDRKNFEKYLNEVLAGGDRSEARLSNLIAKRKARRYLENKIFQEDCGFID